MEKFIFLFRGSDVYEQTQSPEALQALTVKMMDWVGSLVKNGQHVGSEKFHRVAKQLNGAIATVNDNPFSNPKDIIGGCTIVAADNYAQAVDIAKACPILSTNATIEIRQIQSI
jgi:hypothetical protein